MTAVWLLLDDGSVLHWAWLDRDGLWFWRGLRLPYLDAVGWRPVPALRSLEEMAA